MAANTGTVTMKVLPGHAGFRTIDREYAGPENSRELDVEYAKIRKSYRKYI